MSEHEPALLGVILAGGASRRFPGGKASALLAGETLLARAVATVRVAGLEPVVCARETTALPDVDASIWREPDHAGRPHPLRGIAWAAAEADAPIVALPVDLPFLPPVLLATLAAAPDPIAVLASGGRPAALVARISPHAAPALQSAADDDAPALRTLLRLGAALLEIEPGAADSARHALLNVNSPEDLAEAAAILAGGPAPSS